MMQLQGKIPQNFARVHFYVKKKKNQKPAIYEFYNKTVSQYLYSERSEP